MGLKRESEKQRSLKISLKEGAAASASSAFGDSFITPLALFLTPPQFQNLIVGFLSSLSTLFAQLTQIKGSKMMESSPRKSIVLKYVFIQAFLWLPIGILSILYWKNIFVGALPLTLILIYTFISILTGFYYPAWFSWMGDLVPEKERGRYFSKRNRIIGIIGLAISLLGAFCLDIFKKEGFLVFGFTLIFFAAFLFRIISYVYLKKQYSPSLKTTKKDNLSLKEFIKKYPNFTKFSMYQSFFNIAIMFASPFFAVYMLQELKFSYAIYMAITISSTAFYLLFLPAIGKFSDRYGNLKLLYIANIAFIFSPALWLVTSNPWFLILVPQIVAGLGNAALIISVTNFTYASVPQHHRGIGVAYSNIFIGTGVFIGAISGGIILNYASIPFANKFLFIFVCASILRLLVAVIFLPMLKEAKAEKRVPHIHFSLSAPFRSLVNEVHILHDKTGRIIRKV